MLLRDHPLIRSGNVHPVSPRVGRCVGGAVEGSKKEGY